MACATTEQTVRTLLGNPESEVVEFKEAKGTFPMKELGKYFSALSNEANLRKMPCGWLLFGVSDKGQVVGSAYRQDGGLQNLKREITVGTNERLTFLDIVELSLEGRRVVAFRIPPALPGVPTTWHGAVYARENDALVPLPLNKVDLIRSDTTGMDWSKGIVDGATFDDLDPEAVALAKALFVRRQRKGSVGALERHSDAALLDKIGLTLHGKITRTALILVGKPEARSFFDGFVPRITWSLHSAMGNTILAYEHFDIPLLLAVDKAFSKIRNEKYRYLAGQLTLFPEEVDRYDADLVKELINNAIAHQDFRQRGRVSIEEFEDRLVVMNEGAFIPETIEAVLAPGYHPPYYRNQFLCDAMVNLYMIDTNAMGIPRMYEIQRKRCFPLPSYDLSDPTRVKVTVYGRILDPNYTRLLHSEEALDLQTVFLLDKVQKGEPISKEETLRLRRNHLVEGRYPHLYVSQKITALVGQEPRYVRNRGLDFGVCRELVLNALRTCQELNKQQLLEIIGPALPAVLDETQKRRKLENLLQRLKQEGLIRKVGQTRSARWTLCTENGGGN